jgi:hypothetical protein
VSKPRDKALISTNEILAGAAPLTRDERITARIFARRQAKGDKQAETETKKQFGIDDKKGGKK